MPPDFICPKCRKDLSAAPLLYSCPNCGSNYPIIDNIRVFVSDSDRNPTIFCRESYQFLYEFEEKHFWYISRKEMICKMIELQFKNSTKQIKMIEIGCGSGNILRYLLNKNINIEGGDLSFDGLKFCSYYVDVPLYQINATHTPFPSESYDLIGIFDVIEHVDDDQALANELFRICKKNGYIIITVPANNSLWSYFDTLAEHKRRYSKNDLADKLNKAGFRVIKISYFMFFLFPLIWLYRRLNMIHYRKKDPELEKLWEFKSIPVLNNVLLKILRLEQTLLMRLNLPFGASLVCLAKK